MPGNLVCEGCGFVLLGIETTEEPIGHESCPRCGNDEFRVVA
jgi:rubrerythrin